MFSLRHLFKKHKLLMVFMDEDDTEKRHELVEEVLKESDKILYVCLNRPYADVVQSLEHARLPKDRFLFIDVLSSYYGSPPKDEHCIFLPSPDAEAIFGAITAAITDHHCRMIIIDTISSMLLYTPVSTVVQLTYRLQKLDTAGKVLLADTKQVPQGDLDQLTKDLTMFVDKVVKAAR